MIQQQINNNTTVEQTYDGRTQYNDTTVNDDEETNVKINRMNIIN